MVYWIDGEPWEVRLPSVETHDLLIRVLTQDVCETDIRDALAPTQEYWLKNPVKSANPLAPADNFGTITQGISFSTERREKARPNLGVRVVMYPLDPQTLKYAPDRLIGVANGKLLSLGGLYVEHTPWRFFRPDTGSVPNAFELPSGFFFAGKTLRLGDTPFRESERAQFLKVNCMLVSRWNLVTAITRAEADHLFSDGDMQILSDPVASEFVDFPF